MNCLHRKSTAASRLNLGERFREDTRHKIVMMLKGVPVHIRSDNRPAFRCQESAELAYGCGPTTLYIESGSLWENGYCESFNSKP
jgi:hypothetical protein